MTSYNPNITLPRQVFDQPAIAILLPVVAGSAVGYGVSSLATRETYGRIKQPPFSPPPQIFGPAWIALYGMMGYASYRAWSIGTSSPNPNVNALAKYGATLYTIQLGLNLIWMPLYFGLSRPIEALVDIVALSGTAGYLTYIWSGVDETSAWLMVPYLGWLAFATYLCAGTGYLNGWDIKPKAESKTK
ncbi:hypothetical protein MMC09_002910 [Bachmanniomyces sp. S44760]|nr:hypothetical protein [Bachmanniomyces sp. S44760]